MKGPSSLASPRTLTTVTSTRAAMDTNVEGFSSLFLPGPDCRFIYQEGPSSFVQAFLN